jgi:hypothetical protein
VPVFAASSKKGQEISGVSSPGGVKVQTNNMHSSILFTSFTCHLERRGAQKKIRACLGQRVMEGIEGAIIPHYSKLSSRGF